MNIRKQFMEGLILTQDDETLETVVQSLYYELFKEGFVRYLVKQKNLPLGRFFEVSSGFEPL